MALVANAEAIGVMRLVGAQDASAEAFARRCTRRAGLGTLWGTLLGLGAVALLPHADAAGGVLTGLGFQGLDRLTPLLTLPLAAGVAFLATRAAAPRPPRARA